jgi:hypothetical protein
MGRETSGGIRVSPCNRFAVDFARLESLTPF